MNVEVANRLQQLRKAKGLSQEELANILGLSRQAVSKWERAETSPDTDNLICLAKLYNISIDKLLDTGESLDEIKERIAQERIDEISNEAKEDIQEDEQKENEIEENSNNDFNVCYKNENEEIVVRKASQQTLTPEEEELQKKTDNISGRVLLALIGIGIFAYILTAKALNDWSIGWEFPVISIFIWNIFNGLYSDRALSVISFVFVLVFELVALRDIVFSSAGLNLACKIVLYIVLITLLIYSFVAIILLIVHMSKNSKESEIIYFKEKINELNDKHFKDFERLSKK